MLFCSQQFLQFFTLVFAAYWMMPWQKARVYLLLAASLYFYASWNHWLAAIIAVSTTFDFFVARAIDGSSDTRRRELLLSVTITANLGLLCYFRYANFFLASLEHALHAAGASLSLPLLSVILPIGISFYTFEAINYAVDVYRREVHAERLPVPVLGAGYAAVQSLLLRPSAGKAFISLSPKAMFFAT